MTPFALLSRLAGLSHREAAEFLGVRIDTVKSWAAGRNGCRQDVLDELRALLAAEARAADEALTIVGETETEAIEIGYPASDAEASALGWPCVGAWGAMAARVIAGSDRPTRLVPRGSTPASAAAMAARTPAAS